ncbi:hypothetical protein M231_00871 [Tremella mesenterica]|uniref:Uncharacterized protein n=1 Tax=Tremella mesenterica TaxID=5217 RepID=A0A4Q1BV27_TREME|nr:hypothetical protein M231_00871 [Tremella mesenterica]
MASDNIEMQPLLSSRDPDESVGGQSDHDESDQETPSIDSSSTVLDIEPTRPNQYSEGTNSRRRTRCSTVVDRCAPYLVKWLPNLAELRSSGRLNGYNVTLFFIASTCIWYLQSKVFKSQHPTNESQLQDHLICDVASREHNATIGSGEGGCMCCMLPVDPTVRAAVFGNPETMIRLPPETNETTVMEWLVGNAELLPLPDGKVCAQFSVLLVTPGVTCASAVSHVSEYVYEPSISNESAGDRDTLGPGRTEEAETN